MQKRVEGNAEQGANAAVALPAREPVRAPEGISLGSATSDIPSSEETAVAVTPGPQPVKLFGIPLPEPIADVSRSISRGMGNARLATVKALPAFIVNNSSNILGAAHVATEVAMFKASLREGSLIQNPQNPINWVYEPIKTVFSGVAEGAKPKDLNLKELFRGNPVKNVKERLLNMDSATEREYARQMAEGTAQNKVNLSNRWQTRSTFMGLVIWSLSALIPEKKEAPEEIERMAIMRINHPAQYVGERLKQAVWAPDWGHHKRQMLGLGYVLIGAFSTMGAWRGVTKHASGMKNYSFNQGYFMTSVLSLTSSLPLLFALDEKSGYSNFGNIMLGRLAFLPKSIKTKYANNDPGASWYTFSTLSFQAENMMQSLFGGAQKVSRTLPDGTVVEEIISHKDTIDKAKVEAHEIKRHHKQEKQEEKEKQKAAQLVSEKHDAPDAPVTQVTSRRNVEHAMPERVIAAQQQMQEAAV